MTDQNQKKDAGKARFDLVPWGDIPLTDTDYPVDAVLSALQTWWTGRPFGLQLPLPRRQVLGVAQVLGMGAAKYSPRGWEAGISYSRVFAAAVRHGRAYLAGEHVDPESGLAHESHFWCNVVFLVTFHARNQGAALDDRPEASARTRADLDRLEALSAQLSGRTAVSGAGLADPATGKGSN